MFHSCSLGWLGEYCTDEYATGDYDTTDNLDDCTTDAPDDYDTTDVPDDPNTTDVLDDYDTTDVYDDYTTDVHGVTDASNYSDDDKSIDDVYDGDTSSNDDGLDNNKIVWTVIVTASVLLAIICSVLTCYGCRGTCMKRYENLQEFAVFPEHLENLGR